LNGKNCAGYSREPLNDNRFVVVDHAYSGSTQFLRQLGAPVDQRQQADHPAQRRKTPLFSFAQGRGWGCDAPGERRLS
jgi:hypothetical protein